MQRLEEHFALPKPIWNKSNSASLAPNSSSEIHQILSGCQNMPKPETPKTACKSM
jgi:hypothetical protein